MASDEEIWKALEVAQASEFVRKLPDGLDTMILQGGKKPFGWTKAASDHCPRVGGFSGNFDFR